MLVQLLTIGTLLLQAMALGHGAIQLAYHKDKPKWWILPIILILVYNFSLFLLKPHILVNAGSYPAGGLYYSLRYGILALCFTLVVEGLYIVLRKVTLTNSVNLGKIKVLEERNEFLVTVLKNTSQVGGTYNEPSAKQITH